MTAPVLTDPGLGADRYAKVTALDRWALARVLRAWGLLDLSNAQVSFGSVVLPSLLDTMITAQLSAAGVGVAHVDAEAAALGVAPTARVRPAALAGVASDGRSLTGLFAQALIRTYVADRAGVPRGVALQAGADSLDAIVTTQVHDAARVAGSVATTVNRVFTGYRRGVEPGACGRCVILAGRFYRWSDGFDRHPRCRCFNTPVTSVTAEPQDPRELFDAMTPEQQDKSFTVAGAEAIRLGADPAKVVNARKGMGTTEMFGRKVTSTTVGVKRGQQRLMPESILRLAEDRDTAVRLLRLHGFVL
jgi:hypothetical protein